ncbi:Ubiquitin carboxyl-terminal hydrolase ubh-4 [Fusarium oxysporum f. sp. rapae]|uniref:ubiquitinyl hydrolase 1 n=1 Tax=Fusarium oxysporum f. sp. rapae TaxID=485398 RepID=A0A8J5PCN8_FUSOX|nr:Ubiquitin carboxyl-terminal hydrolase ubh-4 [Fusarium oxysporum f. sp. rapae]
MKNELQADENIQGGKSFEDAPFVRRSNRLASKPPQQTTTQATMSGPRRNPKRKASEAANELNHRLNSDKLLDEALAPLSLKDVEEWEGWVELESEPAFFNIILRDLGVCNVKAQEIFTIDQDSLALLPQPVYGLIFLFQYLPGLEEESEEQDATGVWFANQTTSNACATVAMLNIVMNAEGIDLGEKLRAFKESTKDLNTALRGHQISKNNFIRTIHNSFTRRMDHLNADLYLENEASDAKTSTSKRRPAAKKGKRAPPRKKKSNTEYGFHFIAYVPAGGYVWELDGLQYKPHKLDHVPNIGDWTSVARPQIEGRMLQYEESQLSFNLLALCQSPLTAYSQSIAHAAASLRYLHENTESLPAFKDLISAEKAPLDIEEESRLSDFNLTKADIINAQVPDALQEKLKRPSFDTQSAYELHQELVVDVKAAMGEYRSELMAISDDEQRVKGRKKDYGPALHKWMKRLAEKGVLEEVIKAT